MLRVIGPTVEKDLFALGGGISHAAGPTTKRKDPPIDARRDHAVETPAAILNT